MWVHGFWNPTICLLTPIKVVIHKMSLKKWKTVALCFYFLKFLVDWLILRLPSILQNQRRFHPAWPPLPTMILWVHNYFVAVLIPIDLGWCIIHLSEILININLWVIKIVVIIICKLLILIWPSVGSSPLIKIWPLPPPNQSIVEATWWAVVPSRSAVGDLVSSLTHQRRCWMPRGLSGWPRRCFPSRSIFLVLGGREYRVIKKVELIL